MKETILVNNTEIEKAIIKQFLNQNRKLEAVKYICEEAQVSLKTGKYIVDLFQAGGIDKLDGTDLHLEDAPTSTSSSTSTSGYNKQESPNRPEKSKSMKGRLIFALVLIFGVLFYEYGITKDDSNQTTEEPEVAEAGEAAGAEVATDIATEWVVDVAMPIEDLYPVDTNRVVEHRREAEIQIIKDAQFERLKAAELFPLNEDVQSALIRFTKGRLTDVIIEQKLNVKVGTCYENPNTDGAFYCVSCMILLYNRETKTWQEAPNGDNFLRTAYDFYLPSEGDVYWDAKDLSMRIPFDYELFEQYE